MASLWDRTKNLPKEYFHEVKQVYGDHFPLEVRFQLAQWIEENFNPGIKMNADDVASQNMAAQLSQQLLMQLDNHAASISEDPSQFLNKKNLMDISHSLKQRYAMNYLGLTHTVKQCLERELAIVTQFEGGVYSGETSSGLQIRQQLSILKMKMNETGLELERCRQGQEAVTVELYSFKDLDSKYEQTRLQLTDNNADVKKLKETRNKMEVALKQKFMKLYNQRRMLIETLFNNYNMVKEVTKQVLDVELIKWKREQQLAGNGLHMSSCLETIQEWCEGLASIIWTMRQQIKQLEGLKNQMADPNNTNDVLPELLAGVTDLLSNLVTGTFVIEKQPPQVMKTNTRFTATVRLLVGGQLNVHMASPSVSVSIISESQANQLLKAPPQSFKRREDYSSGEILNGTGNMEYHSATRQVSVTFRNLQLKKIKRTEKKGTESVMEEKFSVLFWTEFQIGEMKFQVWTLSLPVVVIVHGNQEPQALATITWDNAFAEMGRRPFCVPDKVPWSQMAAALNMKWTSACGTSRGLTEENLYYLATKAFRNPNIVPDEFKTLTITWGQFCRETLPDRSFTFWEWFYRAMNLTSGHMKGPWNEGYIMGFVSKHKAEDLLKSKNHGCFLLRFSDSELGGVTIAYVRQDQLQKNVFMLAPFTGKDLAQRSIADVISDLQTNLTCLYPNLPSDVFKKFLTTSGKDVTQTIMCGYVPHKIKTQIQDNQYDGMEQANPATPSSYDMGLGYHINSQAVGGSSGGPQNAMAMHPYQQQQIQQDDGMEMEGVNLDSSAIELDVFHLLDSVVAQGGMNPY